MLKLIILSLLGKKIVSSRVLFNSIKSYLIIYMMVLPALLSAHGSGAGSRSAIKGELSPDPEIHIQAPGIWKSSTTDCDHWEAIDRKDETCKVSV